jgi:hypothetical protein
MEKTRSTHEAMLRFDLDDPDARHELALALAGSHLAGFIHDLLHEHRALDKYGAGFDGIKKATPAQIREWCINELSERGLLRVVEE